MALRDTILGARDLRHEDVAVPEWGATVRVGEMTAEARLRFEAERDQERTAKYGGKELPAVRFASLLLRYTLFDPATGEPAFTAADDAALAGKSPAVIFRLFDRASVLNTIGDKEVAKVSGESGAVPSGASPSASR